MSTGRRLAKRSIIGTKVCAPGPDGLWYSGVIQDVKTPPTATITSGSLAITDVCASISPSSSSSSSVSSCSSLSPDSNNYCADTKYIVRFDFKTQSMHSASEQNKSVIMEARRAAAVSSVHISPAQTLRRNAMIKEFRESDLIGPGFRSILGIHLQPGQRVFLTHNGRETSGDVVNHDADKDEVIVKITPIGNEEPIELKKRLEEVRLLESRRSARLADQDRDTDFARLADMGGDRRRTSHSIEVPMPLTPQHNSRKRRPSFTHDVTADQYKEDEMNECHAALILMRLQKSPNGDKWLGSSPGSSSSTSWSSGSASPPLSDDGHAIHGNIMLPHDPAASARIRTTSVSTSDEGIVIDFKEERSKKKSRKFRCTWKGCNVVELTQFKIEHHIRDNHLKKSHTKKPRKYGGDYDSSSVIEEEFYYTEEDDDDDDELAKRPSPASPPTLSHRDMARPPHEDPEYQRQIVGNFKQGRAANYYQTHQQQSYHNNGRNAMHHNGNGSTHITSSQQQQLQNNNTSCIPTSPLAHHNYTWTSTAAVPLTATSASSHGQNHQYQQQPQQQQLLQQQQQPLPPPQQQQQQQQQQHQHNTATLIKHARSSPRPSHSAAPYPSPTYVHHHNYSTSSPASSSSSNSNSSPIIQNNNSANNVLQQLSQQNITVTAHHSGSQHSGNHQSTVLPPPQQQQHQQLSAVTITPNYHTTQTHTQQNLRGQQQQQQPTTASNIVVNSQHQQHHQQQPQQQPPQPHHMPLHHVSGHAVNAVKPNPTGTNRRTRGENKKCRKQYGMERRNEWCTQCKWKKACSRFGD